MAVSIGVIVMEQTMLGQRIRQVRKQKKMTQEQLAEKAEISAYYLGELERGIKMPSLKIFVAIAEVLEISTDALLRDQVPAGTVYLNNEITEKLNQLTPQQRRGAVEILEAYIKAVR